MYTAPLTQGQIATHLGLDSDNFEGDPVYEAVKPLAPIVMWRTNEWGIGDMEVLGTNLTVNRTKNNLMLVISFLGLLRSYSGFRVVLVIYRNSQP